MKRSLKLKDGETIYEWINRLTTALNLTEEQAEAMTEVSKTSYIHGSSDAIDAIKAAKRRYD